MKKVQFSQLQSEKHSTMGQQKNAPQNEAEWEALCSQIEAIVQRGQHEESRGVLLSLNPKNIPRKWATNLARVAWRTDMAIYALKVLQPYIYPENRFSEPATPQEKVQYATSLSSLGINREAIAILNTVDPEEDPEALFHTASSYMYDWNYSAAISPLQKMIALEKVPPYRKLVCKVNLVAAYITVGKMDLAVPLLQEIQQECEKNNHLLLLGNSWELTAQIHIASKKFNSANDALEKAGDILQNQAGRYLLFVEKWKAVVRCLSASTDEEKAAGLELLAKTRATALTLLHWNTMRECDLYEAITIQNEDLLKKVIMGTPSEIYRRRARQYYGQRFIATGRYNLLLTPASDNKTKDTKNFFDPMKKSIKNEALHEKPLLYALYHALLRDFYQPHTLGTLFSLIYPDEKYNPYSSPGRVVQLMRRLNTWFLENEVSLQVQFLKNECRLIATQAIYVVVQRGNQQSADKARDAEIRKHFHGESFTILQLAEAMQASRPTAERWLRKASGQGKVIKERRKHGVVYRFATPRLLKKLRDQAA